MTTKRLTSLICVSLLAFGILMSAVPLLVRSADEKIVGNPASISWTYLTHSIGDSFTIQVNVQDIRSIGGVSVGAAWDSAILQCTGIANGSFLVGNTPASKDLLQINGVINSGSISPVYGWTTTGGYSNSGNGTVATIDFTSLAYGSTTINLVVTPSDPDGNEFTVPIENVSFTFTAPPPPPARPLLFTISENPVNSPGLLPHHVLNGTAVTFTATVTQQAYDNITDTYYDPFGSMWTLYYPNGSIAAGPAALPWFLPMIGDTMTYTFNAPDASALGEWVLEVKLQVGGMNTNWPQWNESTNTESKWVEVPAAGAILELFTETDRWNGSTRITTTYIGIGHEMYADSYSLDENVTLYVNLTYNGAELQSRLIAFEVRNGLNETVLYQTAITNASGIATISFRIMTICLDREHAFGQWIVLAKTTVGEVLTWDCVTFQVGNIVYGLSYPPWEIQRGGMYFGIDMFFSISLMPRYVVATITIYDDLGVPVANGAAAGLIPGASYVGGPLPDTGCNGTSCAGWTLAPSMGGQFIFLMIPKWTYPGNNGVISFNYYTDYVWNCGVAYCPESVQPTVITN